MFVFWGSHHISLSFSDIRYAFRSDLLSLYIEGNGCQDENEALYEKAKSAIDEIATNLQRKLTRDNVEYNKSLIKFNKRLGSIPATRLNSALHEFGSFLMSSARGKIPTQPTRRRRSGIGSRQKQDNRGNSQKRVLTDGQVLPNRKKGILRPHSFTKIVMRSIVGPRKH